MGLNGQPAVQMDYDFENRMLSWRRLSDNAVNSSRYNGFGLRVATQNSTIASNAWYNLLYDGVTPGSPLLYDGQGAYYTQGQSEWRYGTISYHLNDSLGNLEVLTSATQATTDIFLYDAFGNTLVHAGNTQTPLKYGGAAGYQTDPDSGLMLLGYRFYDPSIGRFLTRDPAEAGPNSYSYADNNPANLLDPLGLQAEGGGGNKGNVFTQAVGVVVLGWNALNRFFDGRMQRKVKNFGLGVKDRVDTAFNKYTSPPTYGMHYLWRDSENLYGNSMDAGYHYAPYFAMALVTDGLGLGFAAEGEALTAEEIDEAYMAATEASPNKRGFSRVGHAFAKHHKERRPNTTWPMLNGSPEAVSEQAHNIIADFLMNPGNRLINNGKNYDIIAPDGRRMRYLIDGSFQGLREPEP